MRIKKRQAITLCLIVMLALPTALTASSVAEYDTAKNETGNSVDSQAFSNVESKHPVDWLPATASNLGAETEPNDGPDQATQLTVGEMVQGDFATPTDRDFYRIELESRIIEIQASLDGTGSLQYGVFTENGELIEREQMDAGRSSGIQFTLPEPGAYYILLEPLPTNPATGPYQLAVQTRDVGSPQLTGTETQSAGGGGVGFETTAGGTEPPTFVTETTVFETTTSRTETAVFETTTIAPETTAFGTTTSLSGGDDDFQFTPEPTTPGQRAGSETEPNDSLGEANQITSNAAITGELTSIQDRDVYQLSLTAGETISVEAATGASGEISFDLITPNGQRLTGVTTSSGGVGQLAAGVPETGTYYLVVQPAQNNPGAGPYSFSLESSGRSTPTPELAADPNEPNDEQSSATSLQLGVSQQGAIDGPSDVDVFAIGADEGDTITVFLNRSAGAGAINHYWVQPDGQIIETPGTTILEGEDSRLTLSGLPETGNYYLVLQYHNWTGAYDIQAETTPGTGPETTQTISNVGNDRREGQHAAGTSEWLGGVVERPMVNTLAGDWDTIASRLRLTLSHDAIATATAALPTELERSGDSQAPVPREDHSGDPVQSGDRFIQSAVADGGALESHSPLRDERTHR